MCALLGAGAGVRSACRPNTHGGTHHMHLRYGAVLRLLTSPGFEYSRSLRLVCSRVCVPWFAARAPRSGRPCPAVGSPSLQSCDHSSETYLLQNTSRTLTQSVHTAHTMHACCPQALGIIVRHCMLSQVHSNTVEHVCRRRVAAASTSICTSLACSRALLARGTVPLQASGVVAAYQRSRCCN